MVIDTPGMRELGLWDAGEGVDATFSDVKDLFSRCRFSDCRHQTEPGCAVWAALENGSLSRQRWENYLAQKRETAFVEDKTEYLRNKRDFFKSITKSLKQNKKGRWQ